MTSALDADPPSRRKWCRAALALPVLALGGCIVAPYGTYFRPSTAQPGSRERREWCAGTAGPVTGIDVDLGSGLQLRAWTGRAVAAGVPLRIEVTVLRNTTLGFTEAPRVLAAGRPLALQWNASANRTISVDPGDWIDPQALRPGDVSSTQDAPYGQLTLRTQTLRVPAPQRMVVQGLALVREGRANVSPPITLARVASRTQVHAYRSAEEQANLQARFETCRRETPQLACQNILDFGGASHSGEWAGARWQWRWWGPAHASGHTLESELAVAPREPGRWRIADTALQLRDLDSGAVHALQLARPAQLSFRDHLELQRGVAAAPADTRVLLETMIPEVVPTFDVLLPPLLSKAERVVALPLRFDRRTFDGGIEPFNC